MRHAIERDDLRKAVDPLVEIGILESNAGHYAITAKHAADVEDLAKRYHGDRFGVLSTLSAIVVGILRKNHQPPKESG